MNPSGGFGRGSLDFGKHHRPALLSASTPEPWDDIFHGLPSPSCGKQLENPRAEQLPQRCGEQEHPFASPAGGGDAGDGSHPAAETC